MCVLALIGPGSNNWLNQIYDQCKNWIMDLDL